MSEQPYSPEFKTLFCQMRDSISYLNNLDDILRFPQFVYEHEYETYPAASEFYLSPIVSKPYNDDDLYIIRLAHRACAIHDNSTEIVFNSLKKFSVLGFKNPPPALGGLNKLIENYPLEIRALIYDLISLLAHKKPIAELWSDVIGGDLDALTKLVRIDKSAITTPEIAQIIRLRQFEGDWTFFENIAKSIKDHPISNRDYRPIEIILTARFWREEFHRWPRQDLYNFLEEMDVLPRSSSNHESFRQTLNSLGLKKDKGRPKKVK